MTNKPDFNLDAELEETDDWDSSEEAEFQSGYADEPDPEEDEPTAGAMDLAERHALRRVAGLSTELEDITEVEYRQLRLERVVLVGVWTDGTVAGRRELDGRARAARRDRRLRGARGDLPAPAERPTPRRTSAAARSTASARSSQATGADTVICDGELAPSQLRNLEDRLKVKVVDRTALILDIFAQHAKSRRARRRSSWPSSTT